jgi:hypothetical protein
VGIDKSSEEFLAGYDGRSLPTHVARSCLECGMVCGLDIVRTFDGVGACQWKPGFMVVCDCGVSGPYSETRVGALSGWNDMIFTGRADSK